MIYSKEVEEMCTVAQGVNHGCAPIPEEAKWVKAKEDVYKRQGNRFCMAGKSEEPCGRPSDSGIKTVSYWRTDCG